MRFRTHLLHIWSGATRLGFVIVGSLESSQFSFGRSVLVAMVQSLEAKIWKTKITDLSKTSDNTSFAILISFIHPMEKETHDPI